MGLGSNKPILVLGLCTKSVTVGAALRGRPSFKIDPCERRAATEGRPHNVLRAPEPSVERRQAGLAALTRAGSTGRAAGFADPVVALLVTEDISASAELERLPAALECPSGWYRGCSICATTGWLRHARDE